MSFLIEFYHPFSFSSLSRRFLQFQQGKTRGKDIQPNGVGAHRDRPVNTFFFEVCKVITLCYFCLFINDIKIDPMFPLHNEVFISFSENLIKKSFLTCLFPSRTIKRKMLLKYHSTVHQCGVMLTNDSIILKLLC